MSNNNEEKLNFKNINYLNIAKILYFSTMFLWACLSIESLFMHTEIFNIPQNVKFSMFVNGLWIYGSIYVIYLYSNLLGDIEKFFIKLFN